MYYDVFFNLFILVMDTEANGVSLSTLDGIAGVLIPSVETPSSNVGAKSGRECHVCLKTFSNGEKFRRHMATHTPSFVCTMCDKRFADGGKLRRHEVTHTGIRPFSCELCGKSVSRREHLRRHMLTHSDVRPFSCDLCEYVARRRDSVRSHIRSKHPDASSPSSPLAGGVEGMKIQINEDYNNSELETDDSQPSSDDCTQLQNVTPF